MQLKQLSCSTMHKQRLLFLALFTLLYVCEAKDEGMKELRSYWRSVMKDEDMPEAIKGLVVVENGQKLQETGFVKEFETRPNVILYDRSLEHHQEHVEHPEMKGLPEKDRKLEPGRV